MAAPSRSFAAAAASPAVSATVLPQHPIPTGSWSVYYHEPEDNTWTAESYKRIAVVSSWEQLGAVLRELGPHKTMNGLLRIMVGDTSPLWENKVNIRGGSYCLKISRRSSVEVFNRYMAAAALGMCTTNPENRVVGVTISPKKGSCIIKIWNLNADAYHQATDLPILHEEVRHDEVIYRPHTEQRM
jgi:hypothetical protein